MRREVSGAGGKRGVGGQGATDQRLEAAGDADDAAEVEGAQAGGLRERVQVARQLRAPVEVQELERLRRGGRGPSSASCVRVATLEEYLRPAQKHVDRARQLLAVGEAAEAQLGAVAQVRQIA